MNDFLNDPRVLKGKAMILAALQERQQMIRGVRKTDPQAKIEFEHLLKEFQDMRGGALFYPYIGSGFGNGSLVELLDGSIKYDFITGIGVHGFGHSDLAIISASIDAALGDVVMEGHLQQNQEAIDLTALLLEISGMDHCFLSSTGVMANENGCKIAFHAKGSATRILAFEHCFMGRTLALSQVTDKPAFRKGLPLNLPVDYIPFYDPNTPEASTARASKALKSALQRYPGAHGAMCFEFIQGEGGYNVGTREFFVPLMEILKEHKIPILADEVQTFGRLETPFAFQFFGLEEYVDIVTIGKLSQTCATLFKANLKPAPGLLSQTFTTSATALRASKILIEQLENRGHFGKNGRNNAIYEKFVQRFEKIRLAHPDLLRGPYGMGAMVAFTPLSGDENEVIAFVKNLFEEGVLSFTCGSEPFRCRFLPPLLAVTDEEIDGAMEIVERVLKKMGGKDG